MKTRVYIAGFLTALVLAVLLITINNKNQSASDAQGITRAQAAKMLALLQVDEAALEDVQASDNCKDVDANDWYAPYITESLRLGLMEVEKNKFYPQQPYTYDDAKTAMTALGISKDELSFVLRGSRTMPKEEVIAFYELLVSKVEGALVSAQQVYLYAYDAQEQTASTSAGELDGSGYDMSALVEQCVTLYCQQGVVALEAGRFDGDVTIANAWCERSAHGSLTIYANGYEVTLDADFSDGQTHEAVVADVNLNQNKVVSVAEKTNVITGKVVALTDEDIEIDGQGTYRIAQDMPIYRVYDTLHMETTPNILMSYTEVCFVCEEDSVIAAFVENEERLQQIRVLLNTSGYGSVFHDSVTLHCSADMTITCEGEQTNYSAGESITITKDNEQLLRGRMVLSSASADATFTIESINRAYGAAVYHGTIELKLYNEGICVINDVPLETYLYAVVPSEMPVSYGSESLKVQAVCARSFAYAQLLNPGFGEYGAHLDDSVNSQVYNNAKECAESIAAVDDTCGQVLYCGDELVTTYFFSTSCGYTSNVADVWSSRTSPAYLTGGLQAESDDTIDLSSEKRFRQFIDEVDAYDFYEQDYGWFRWNVTIKEEQMQDTINANLADVAKYCSVKQADGSYKQQELASIGTLQGVTVDARGTCGVITKLRVLGSDAEVLVSSEYAVRKLLGSAQYTISLNDNTTSQQAMLPSGYFYMDEVTADDGSTQYEIHGGGYGHGVGMSQNGVKAMCQRGYTFDEILAHYYPDTECRNIY